MVSLSCDKRRRERALHRLVAEAFLGVPPTERHQVNHVDGNKANNRLDNLEWVTPQENSQHAYDAGLHAPLSGARIHTTKVDEAKVREIRKLAADGVSQGKLAALYGLTKGPIHAIIHRRTWKHVD